MRSPSLLVTIAYSSIPAGMLGRRPSMWPLLSSLFYCLPHLMRQWSLCGRPEGSCPRSVLVASGSVELTGSKRPSIRVGFLPRTPDPACALGACEASGGSPLLIIGSLCEPVPRNECPTPAQNCLSCPQDLLALWGGLDGRLSLENRSHWEVPGLQKAPECDQ